MKPMEKKHNRLLYAQAVEVCNAPRRPGFIKELALKYDVSEALIAHCRHKARHLFQKQAQQDFLKK